jgi:hypothetical protein
MGGMANTPVEFRKVCILVQTKPESALSEYFFYPLVTVRNDFAPGFKGLPGKNTGINYKK